MNYKILIQGGIGDVITRLARLDALLNPEDRVQFDIYSPFTFPPSEILIRQLIAEDPRALSDSGPVDQVLDWRDRYGHMAWPLQVPFRVSCPEEAYSYTDQILPSDGKNCIIHPITSEGNARGFEAVRHWDLEEWQDLIDILRKSGYNVFQIGVAEDNHPFDGVLDLCGKVSLFQSIALILRSDLVIGVNSWPIEVAAYALIPTVIFWFVADYAILTHFDRDYEDKFRNMVLIRDREKTAQQAWDAIEDKV